MILGTVILTEFIPMIKLCYMAQLTWRQGDYLGGPDLLWANEEQRDFFARLEKRKSKIQSTRQIPCALLTWRWVGPHDKQCGQPPGDSRPSRQSNRKLRSWSYKSKELNSAPNNKLGSRLSATAYRWELNSGDTLISVHKTEQNNLVPLYALMGYLQKQR